VLLERGVERRLGFFVVQKEVVSDSQRKAIPEVSSRQRTQGIVLPILDILLLQGLPFGQFR
jgi:hypothetical protein